MILVRTSPQNALLMTSRPLESPRNHGERLASETSEGQYGRAVRSASLMHQTLPGCENTPRVPTWTGIRVQHGSPDPWWQELTLSCGPFMWTVSEAPRSQQRSLASDSLRHPRLARWNTWRARLHLHLGDERPVPADLNDEPGIGEKSSKHIGWQGL